MGTKFHWAFAQWNFTKAAQIQNIYDLNLWTIIWFSFASAQNLRVLKTPWFGICGDTVIWVRAPYLLQRFLINIFEDVFADSRMLKRKYHRFAIHLGWCCQIFLGYMHRAFWKLLPWNGPKRSRPYLWGTPDVAGKFWWQNEETEK